MLNQVSKEKQRKFINLLNKLLDKTLIQRNFLVFGVQSLNNPIENNNLIFQNKEEDYIIRRIKTHKILEILKEEQTRGLRKDLLSLWNINKFKKSIESIRIQDLLTTPFLLEIIVQVLPNILKQQQGSIELKNMFIHSYLTIKERTCYSEKLKEKYKKQKNKIDQDCQIQTNFQGKQSFQQLFKLLHSDLFQSNVNEIVDQLESQNFFSVYSITSNLKIQQDQLFVDDIKFKLKNQDIENVLQALKMKKFTIYEFYENFIDFYHDQQIQKLRGLGKISNLESFHADIMQFSFNLALDMTMNELSQVTYQQKGKLKLKNIVILNYKILQQQNKIYFFHKQLSCNYYKFQDDEELLDQYFNESSLESDYNKLIRSCILLSAKGSTYSFTHKSIQEFYVAKYIFDLLLSIDEKAIDKNNLSQNLQKRLMEQLYNNNKLNLTKEHFKGVLTLLMEKINNISRITQKLIYLVKLSRNKRFINASSNSIYLLLLMDIYLGFQEFKQIQLFDTNISGLSFCYSDLSESKFQKVNINSCNFNYVNLTNAKWEDIICKEKPQLKEYEGGIVVLEFCSNGKFFASGSKNGLIKMWNIETYQSFVDLNDHKKKINSLAFSPDNKILASASSDKTIKLWNIQDLSVQQLISTINYHDYEVKYVQFTADGKQLFSLDIYHKIILCNIEKIQERPKEIEIKCQAAPSALVFSNDETKLAIGDEGGNILLIELKTMNEQYIIGHNRRILVLEFSQKRKQLASACIDLLLILWKKIINL